MRATYRTGGRMDSRCRKDGLWGHCGPSKDSFEPLGTLEDYQLCLSGILMTLGDSCRHPSRNQEQEQEGECGNRKVALTPPESVSFVRINSHDPSSSPLELCLLCKLVSLLWEIWAAMTTLQTRSITSSSLSRLLCSLSLSSLINFDDLNLRI